MVKVGIEIHQQLDTGKLFCSCPSEISEGNPDFTIKRRLRISKGEGGKTDKAAMQEVLKGKEYEYQGFYDTTCLVELDEEPPHEMNGQALNVALNVAKTLNCTILDRIQVMRKIVLDGSNTSGFQRTALVAVDGEIEYKGKKVTIPVVCIEEDACKIEKRGDFSDIYNLSRLGIPLIEITTGPDIDSGEMCKGVAEYIGMVLRSVGSVKRGIGTIRQDVNVSIPKGSRVEIKGAQELKLLPTYVDFEAQRQKSILDLTIPEIKNNQIELTQIFKKTECTVIKNFLRINGKVFGIKLHKMEGLLGKELQPGNRLGTDLSDYAKIKTGIGGLFHSDELPKYGVSEEEVTLVRGKLKCSKNDAFIIISHKLKRIVERSLNSVVERLNMLSKGVPEEVRKALPNGSTSYLRPMPGGARMYPETDLLLITPKLSEIKPTRMLTDLASELEKKHKFSKDLAKLTIRSPKVDFIVDLIKQFMKIKPAFISETVLSANKVIKKEYNTDIKVKDIAFEKTFKLLNEGKIVKDVVLEILSKTGKKTVEVISRDYAGADSSKLEAEVKNIVENNRGVSANALMGIIMGRFRGKVSGGEVAKLLKKYMKV